jgi:hypothetical protein
MIIREWPKGHRLFTEGDFHMSFDPPEEEGKNPAIVMKINGNTATVYAMAVFATDEEALKWFAKQRKKYSH